MARQSVPFFSFNRGEISLLALARVDVEKLRLAAQSQINWLPRVLGPMMLRPGTEFIGEILDDAPCKPIPYVSAFNDTALLELTAGNLRIWRDDALISRAAVSTTIPDFPSWTTTTTGTAVATTAAGSLSFSSMNNGASALADVAISVALADRGVEHGLRFTITNGPVAFSVGTAAGTDDVFSQETLDNGVYSMAFTPTTSTVYVNFRAIRLANNSNTKTNSIPTWSQTVQVENIYIEPAGTLILPTPWGSSIIGNSAATPSLLRHDQSANIIYFAASGLPQKQINRYSPTSWSVVDYRPVKGPMSPVPSNPSVTIATNSYSGNVVLTASGNLFKPSDVGTLFRLFSTGQIVSEVISFSNTYSDAIEVTGVSYVSTIDGGGNVVNTATADRNFFITTTGTWVGNLKIQRSFTSATTGFSDYKVQTSNVSSLVITDGLNNEIVWYRVGFGPGDLTSGSVTVTITYAGGGNYGVAHVTSYVSPTQVDAEVLVPFWGLAPTSDWLQSEWSSSAGYPSAVAIHEGRLHWAGADKWWGSVSDDYSNFDYDATGDAAPIDQSIGSGPIANINWLVSIDHLLAGADTSIITAMSDAIETPLTPTNFTLRRSATNGSYQIQAEAIDQRVVYVDQSGRRIYELIYDIRLYNYKPTDLTRLNPDIGLVGFTDLAVQRQPDTRVNLIRTDGVLVSLINDADDEVQAFWRIVTDGAFEAVAVLPGAREDQVYVVVNRTINGVTKRYLEKFARIDECQGEALTKCVDAHLVYQGAATNVLAGFFHLVGKTVAIWGQRVDGVVGDWGTAVVAADGTVTIPNNVQVVVAVVGLSYTAEFISAKLEYAAREGSGLNKIKRIDHMGVTMINSHCQGLRYGVYDPGDEDNTVSGPYTFPPVLDDMPQVEGSVTIDPNTVWAQYDFQQMEFPSDFSTDNRIYLQAASPRPVTLLGIAFDIQTSD